MDLFEYMAEKQKESDAPLASRMRPETLDDIEYEADAGQGGLIEAAMYRAYDAELPIGMDEELGQLRGRIPSLGQKIPLLEENRLRLRNAARGQSFVRQRGSDMKQHRLQFPLTAQRHVGGNAHGRKRACAV